MPADKYLVETDSPYLAPVPFRGKPNEPAYVLHVAEHIAELRDESIEVIANQTTENFLITISSINTINFSISVLTFYLIQRARNGSIIAISQLKNPI